MLLENSNISFEAKLPNTRQTILETFGPNEEPITDDFIRYIKDMSASIETNTEGEDPAFGSLTDIREIHNSKSEELYLAAAKTENENTIIILPNEKVSSHRSISPQQISKYNETDGCLHFREDEFENKENIHLEELSKLNSISNELHTADFNSLSNQKMESSSRNTKSLIPNNLINDRKCSSMSKTNSENEQKPISSIDGVRPVNVEMFTVILKSKPTKCIHKTDS